MKVVEVTGTVQDVAKVITALYEDVDGEVLIVGNHDQVTPTVMNCLKDFKCTFVDNLLDDDQQFIRIFD